MWKFEHSVECEVSRGFAWRFWTNVDNWAAVDPSLESVKLNGPFAAGTKGTTKPCDLHPIDWQLTEVQDRTSAVIEVPVPGAIFRFLWRFEDSPSGGARITQQVRIEGEQADHYVGRMGPEFEKGIPQGMRRLAEEMIRAAGKQA